MAKSANKAHGLVDEFTKKSKATDEKLSQVDKMTQQAHTALKNIETATEFATVLLAAQNDNWKAFDQLREFSEDKSFPLRKVAANAYVSIQISYGSPIRPGYLNMNLVSCIDPSELSLSQLEQTYLELDPINHAHLVHVVCGRYNLSKKDKMAFLVDVLKTSNSITARYYAADFFLKAAADSQLKWQPFQIDPLLSWWEQHSDTIE
ncbi:MAG: hypothetical protein K8S15_08900 [Candidatus Aegiribacteria sp.]|nr:hypothetical protein [Candidatus Aegiribacteria sp.]